MRFSGPCAAWIPPPTPEVDPRVAAATALTPRGIVFRTPLLARLNAHAIELCLQHRITATRSADTGGRAHLEARRIVTPAVTNEAHYAVTLHEIGHVVSPDGDSRQYTHVIADDTMIAVGGELGAWRWAVDHALAWTQPMQDRMYGSLLRHRQRATPAEVGEMVQLLVSASLRVAPNP